MTLNNQATRLIAATVLTAWMSAPAAMPVTEPTIQFAPSHAKSKVSSEGDAAVQVELADPGHFASFELAEGESHTFDFFEIEFDEGSYATVSRFINAELTFDAPEVSGKGKGTASRKTFWRGYGFEFDGGSLRWDSQPESIDLGYGNTFSITLSEFDDNDANDYTRTVTATIFANSVTVPEPGTLGLLTLAVLALGFRRTAQHQT